MVENSSSSIAYKARPNEPIHKSFGKEGQCFMYLRKQCEKLSDAKIKEGIFDGPQIHKMFKDQNFIHHMNEIEKSAWLSFKSIAENFLGNHKSHDYEELVYGLLDNYQRLGR